MRRRRLYSGVKRVLDALCAALLLFFLLLPMTLVGLAVALTSPGGAIFRQTRVGRDGRLFTCYKFRTMTADAPADCPTACLEDPERYITPIGRLLRRSSLDELPQLFNVLRGDMSLVGPRPLIPREEELHRWRQRTGVFSLRPGLTGLAQVSGRDLLDPRRKVRMDACYARTVSLRTDLHILRKTLGGVLRASGVREGREGGQGKTDSPV